MVRIVLHLMFVVGLALPVTVLGPVPASANVFEDIGEGITGAACALASCDPFTAETVCRVTQVQVGGTAARHTYQFEVMCDDRPFSKVSAVYDYGAGRASEKLSSLSGPPWSLESKWTCSDDPWIYVDTPPACSSPQIHWTGASQYEPDVALPVSVYALTVNDRHVLAAQLQNALNAAGAPVASGPTVKLGGKVKIPGTVSTLPICEAARLARERNSPAAPGLEQQCAAAGTITPPTAPIDLGALQAKGVAIANLDLLTAQVRKLQFSKATRRGFDIATAIFGDPALGAQGNTSTGPGSLKIRDSLDADGQRGFDASVAFHLSRDYSPSAKGGGPITSPLPPPGSVQTTFSGTWDASTSDGFAYEIRLSQSGKHVSGSYTGSDGSVGKINGDLKGHTLRFAWQQTDGNRGTGKFRLAEDGQSFAGSYSLGNNPDKPSGGWNGTRQ